MSAYGIPQLYASLKAQHKTQIGALSKRPTDPLKD
jgi:hypothetical protein